MRCFKDWEQPVIEHGKPTRWGWIVLYPEKLKLGMYTDIGWGVLIHAGAGVEIGDYAQIGGGTKIYSVDTIDDIRGPVFIGRNARIGANSVILPHAYISENSIVGALSLVKNVMIPPNEMWGGVPARKIKDL